MESAMSIHHDPTPEELAVLSDAIQALCRRHDLDDVERADVASHALYLYRQGRVAFLKRDLDEWYRQHESQRLAEAV
jgi:hypothetical protein